jgi:selenide, water dikinase
VLRHILPVDDPAVLVDASTADDAAVYRLDEDRALVVTADFFTPIVDDPYDFGRVAAANALSDIYAMGARPLLALNLVAFPRRLLGQGILEAILRGGGALAREAGVAVLGGHSIDDAEPKYGMCVVGEVRPADVVRNSTARPGDVLVLTKPIGTGVIATAIKAGAAPAGSVAAAIASMTTLNRRASEAMLRHGVHACTDVTGYGLLGHLLEMVTASGVSARIDPSSVDRLPAARELAAAGHIPGGTHRNLKDLEGSVDWGDTDGVTRTLLADAQTSGGLLMALAPDAARSLVDELGADPETGIRATVMGDLGPGPARITVGTGRPGG